MDQPNYKSFYTLKNKNKDNLSFATFGANVTLSLFINGSKPTNVLLTREVTLSIIKTLTAARDSQPDKKYTFSQQTWNPDDRKYNKTNIVIVCGKDENNKIYMDFSGPTINPVSRFELVLEGGLTIGNEPMTIEQKSKLKTDVLLEFLKVEIPQMRNNIRFGYTPTQFKGNYGTTTTSSSESSVFDQ